MRPNRRYIPIDGSFSLESRWVIFNSLQFVLILQVFTVDCMCMRIEVGWFEIIYCRNINVPVDG